MSTPFTTACTGLAVFMRTVPGIRNAYDLSSVGALAAPDNLGPSNLPAVVIDYPADPGEWSSMTFQGGGASVLFTVTQLALLYQITATQPVRKGLPLVATFLDNLATSLKAAPYLVPSPLAPGVSPPIHGLARVTVQPMVIPYGILSTYGVVLKWEGIRVNL